MIPERLDERMAAVGFSQSQLAKTVSLSQTAISRLLAGKSRNSPRIHQIARALHTTAEYLTGEVDDPAEPVFMRSATQLYRQGADRRPGDVATPEDFAREMGLDLIPELQIGYSMGGGSIFEDYQQTGIVPFKREWLRSMMAGSVADLFVARGEGDSMQPTLLDGDIVLIDTAQRDVRQQDRIWALSYGDLGMIKRVRRLPGGSYQVNSDNPAVTPIEAHDDEMHVIGRVIWIGRRM